MPVTIPVRNVDGTLNRNGSIKKYIRQPVQIGNLKPQIHNFLVTELGNKDFILGFPWLQQTSAQINWNTGTIKVEEPVQDDIHLQYDDSYDIDGSEIFDQELIISFLGKEEYNIQAKATPATHIAQQHNITKNIEDLIPEHYHPYKDIFEKRASERFPPQRSYDHAIELKEGFQPRNCRIYPLSPKETEAMNEFIEENLRKGYIRESKSPMASPLFFVEKKDGSLRPCQDYQHLNEGTIKNAYPLPLIQDLIDKIKGAKHFSKFDLRAGYNNIRIKEGDQWKAAFKCAKGLFEPTVMFFGLCNSPATFQAFMNDIFTDMLDEGWMVIYMDDILIFSDNLEEHQK